MTAAQSELFHTVLVYVMCLRRESSNRFAFNRKRSEWDWTIGGTYDDVDRYIWRHGDDDNETVTSDVRGGDDDVMGVLMWSKRWRHGWSLGWGPITLPSFSNPNSNPKAIIYEDESERSSLW